jgi:pimeloyl-ACP methyl ester carboxylesterase
MHRYRPQALSTPRTRRPRAHVAAVPGEQTRLERPQGTAHVVCLHASASSGRQWHTLQGRLADGYQVLSPDLYGSGDSPPWPPGRGLTLADEVALLEPVFEAVAGRATWSGIPTAVPSPRGPRSPIPAASGPWCSSNRCCSAC